MKRLVCRLIGHKVRRTVLEPSVWQEFASIEQCDRCTKMLSREPAPWLAAVRAQHKRRFEDMDLTVGKAFVEGMQKAMDNERDRRQAALDAWRRAQAE